MTNKITALTEEDKKLYLDNYVYTRSLNRLDFLVALEQAYSWDTPFKYPFTEKNQDNALVYSIEEVHEEHIIEVLNSQTLSNYFELIQADWEIILPDYFNLQEVITLRIFDVALKDKKLSLIFVFQDLEAKAFLEHYMLRSFQLKLDIGIFTKMSGVTPFAMQRFCKEQLEGSLIQFNLVRANNYAPVT